MVSAALTKADRPGLCGYCGGPILAGRKTTFVAGVRVHADPCALRITDTPGVRPADEHECGPRCLLIGSGCPFTTAQLRGQPGQRVYVRGLGTGTLQECSEDGSAGVLIDGWPEDTENDRSVLVPAGDWWPVDW
jgi:hypothetical protein